jgi:hypothetical protein
MTAVTSVMVYDSKEAAMTHLDTDAQVTAGRRLHRTPSCHDQGSTDAIL